MSVWNWGRAVLLLAPLALATVLPVSFSSAASCSDSDEWLPLFNGKNLEGWTPKITGYEFGDNYADTFRVENGVIKVGYDKYKDKEFDGKFGHLFYKDKFSHYRLRVEYRFTGEQCKGGPGWATRNSGVMFHCQDPKTMRKDQEFPVSIEAQFLGGLGKGKRTTNNMCSPGTNIVDSNGKLYTPHCLNSKSETYDGDVWVSAEIEVNGSGVVKHFVEGKLVMEYQKPQLDPKDDDAKKLIKDEKNLLLEEGYIALQAESHPVEFRKVEIKVLKK
ncbi:hypothetical protein GobsT_42830 [Gemmata obscuriglobus]|uniref:DUF1080 domain-containing protein n=1 Tax=Gemmata obscuriglobus TaxID=114 RepID=A0A2Z3H7R2_9BACT|nr:DUF1080 domain-containing protein [Gemmata obscuriglobus]AWM37704.1 DUF1080 domain-containing protein [Gemmata obscuriglobus]QEG29487.1 hypothetical protein GobsT_42830 [Gemmata obscuriglobus]VTS08647.1 secreted protein containing duf1080 : Uncharacterized protein OS=Planctomyces limnophilus (strain ATCC 43296 / DSM 3776 / IFAM 1008 / 290) GN=Plim_3672 PE=4 SV=1: DUF1080 [Gemmata obscuriglobus UQM 2246]